jgi:NAD(P)H dehydrogenase (quinone)
MKISVILAHPDPNSFNHAIGRTSVDQLEYNRHGVRFHDLYAENFDPLLGGKEILPGGYLPQGIRRHCQEIAEAEGIIIIHPNWWGQPPAILTGWIDRVIRPGIAYEFLEGDSGEGIPKGLLCAKAALVLNTSNTEPEREKAVFGDPLEMIWKNCVFGLCGVHSFYRRTFSVIITSTEAQRRQWLGEVTALIDSIFPKEEQAHKRRGRRASQAGARQK